MKSTFALAASAIIIGGIVMIGLGFWKMYPSWTLIGAGLILGGYAIGMVAQS